MLRYRSDIKTLIYLLVISGLMVILYIYGSTLPRLAWAGLWCTQLIMAITVGVIVHNHRHVPIWKGTFLNTLTDVWLSLLYGFPVFGWIPTHLQNHHMYTNTEPDYTKTYAFSEKNNLFTLIYYPMYSGMVQQRAIRIYVKNLYSKNRRQFWRQMLQVIALVTLIVVAFLIDWKAALLYVVLPQQISLNSVLVFNYIQHVHADETSKWNHSRNIEGPLNTFLFNNGLHTAHHEKPHLHWSRLPEYHAEIRDKIDPSLNEKSLIWFIIRQYLIAPFHKSWATKSPHMQKSTVET